ncbi:MAG: hypothetical protein E7A67_05795, partial [Peptostreptococcus anaerobius]|nr:hypothetical protein [Peptostreptococcus anaerobius]
LYSLTYPFIIFDKIASILKNFLVSVTYVLTTKKIQKKNMKIIMTKSQFSIFQEKVVSQIDR